MIDRTLLSLLGVALALGGGPARADAPANASRTADGHFIISSIEQEQGHNHINLVTHTVQGGHATDRVRRLEVTVRYERDRQLVTRRFSGTVRNPAGSPSGTPDVPGTEPFYEDATYYGGTLFFALPHDFGGVQAWIDVQLFFDGPIPCSDGADGLCESADGFLNYLPVGNSPTVLDQPAPGADATDLIPEQTWLL